MFDRLQQPGTATVVARKTGRRWFGLRKVEYSAAHGVSEAFDYVLDVHPSDGSPPFRAVLKGPWQTKSGRFRAPEEGQRVKVRCDPSRQKVAFDESDPTVFRPREPDAQTAAEDRRFAAAARGTAPAPKPTPKAAPKAAHDKRRPRNTPAPADAPRPDVPGDRPQT